MANKREEPEIRVRGIGDKLREELNNIAANEGITLSSLLKPTLREFSEKYPEHMKKPPIKE